MVSKGTAANWSTVAWSPPLPACLPACPPALQVRSPKLLSIKFEEGQVSTPELLADVTFPANVEVLGQKLDLTPLQVGGCWNVLGG